MSWRALLTTLSALFVGGGACTGKIVSPEGRLNEPSPQNKLPESPSGQKTGTVKFQDLPKPAAKEVKLFINLLKEVNDARKNEGLKPLRYSMLLAVAAQSHALDMNLNTFFAHQNKFGETVWNRVTKLGYPRWATIGENIAQGYDSAAAAMTGWMNSPAHKENMLFPEYTEMGIGHVEGVPGKYHHMWVQTFGSGDTTKCTRIAIELYRWSCPSKP